LLLVGCDTRNTRSLQEHTANVTAAATRTAGAVARGVVVGLTRKGPLDLNKASAADLATLPGLTSRDIQSMIKGRPYENTNQLVKRKILPKVKYNKIKAQIGVK
jgi:DNA uptake protein ComE-like DNA-binding protein